MQKYVACNDVHSLDLELNFFFFSVNGINHCSVIEQSESSKRAHFVGWTRFCDTPPIISISIKSIFVYFSKKRRRQYENKWRGIQKLLQLVAECNSIMVKLY